MPGSSLFALLDDITLLLDDVAAMTKVATKKTAGVLGDDLALNAEQLTGLDASREVPVVLKVARGSAINKAILVPAALAISGFAPWLVTPLLMVGGAFLCFEGVEKLAHKFLHSKDEIEVEHKALRKAALSSPEDLAAFEKEKVKGAVRTDFVLSAEIVVIALGSVADQPLSKQATVLAALSVIMTIGVYGLVIAIVKIDDAGLWLAKRSSAAAKGLGRGLLAFAPLLMKFLSIAGTIAMFLVGGGILAHGIPGFDDMVKRAASSTISMPLLPSLVPSVLQGLLGVVAGAVILAVFATVKKALPKKKAA
jgi:uncharacterized protein